MRAECDALSDRGGDVDDEFMRSMYAMVHSEVCAVLHDVEQRRFGSQREAVATLSVDGDDNEYGKPCGNPGSSQNILLFSKPYYFF